MNVALALAPDVASLRRRFVKGIEYWIGSINVGGVRFRRSFGQTSRVSERQARDLLDAEHRRIRFVGPDEATKDRRPLKFIDACALLIESMEARRARPASLRQVRLAIKNHLKPMFGRMTCGQIDRAALDRYLAVRQRAAVRTVNRELAVLSRILHYAVSIGRIPRVPCGPLTALPDQAAREIRIPTTDEVGKLLGYRRPEVRLAAAAGFYAGLRPDEVCHLTWAGINFAAGTLTVKPVDGWRPKTRAGTRTIPLHPVLRRELEHMRSLTRWHGGRVLTDAEGQPISSVRLKDLWDYACRSLGLGKLHRQALRHAWATLMLTPREHGGAGQDVRTVMELGGWSSPNIPMRIYAHTNLDRSRAGIEALPAPGAQLGLKAENEEPQQ